MSYALKIIGRKIRCFAEKIAGETEMSFTFVNPEKDKWRRDKFHPETSVQVEG